MREEKRIAMEQQTYDIADYLINNKATVRDVATHFGLSKSCAHWRMTALLPDIDPQLAIAVESVLLYNKSMRATRGGYATSSKFHRIREAYKRDER